MPMISCPCDASRTMSRYRGSKMCSGKGTPGNKTTLGNGKTGMMEGKSIDACPWMTRCGGGCKETVGRTARGRRPTRARRARCVVRPVVVVLLSAASMLGACSQPRSLTAAERGRRVYLANCITCHNPDPTQPGSAGPEVAGASRELLEARVIHAAYPPGYTPKRATHAMVALPYLAERIDDLAAFLATPGR